MATLSDTATLVRDRIEAQYASTGQRRFSLCSFRDIGPQLAVAEALQSLADAHWVECRAKLLCAEHHVFNVIACGDLSRAISETYCDECDRIYAIDDIEAVPSYTMTEPWTRSIPQKKSPRQVTG